MTKTAALSDLFLSHFRSHLLTRIDVEVPIVAVYGANGAGKTNILEAISLLSPGRGLRRAAVDDMRYRSPDAPGWKVAATLKTGDASHKVETWAEAGAGRQVRIDGKPAPQTRLGHLARILWLVPAMDRLWTEAADGRRRFLDRITLSFEPEHADDVLRYEKAMRERNRLLKEQVQDSHWYAAVEVQMAQSGERIIENRRQAIIAVTDAQQDGESAFPKAALRLVGPDAAVEFPDREDDLAAALASGRARDLAAGRTLSGPHRCDLEAIYAEKGVLARNASTGEQKALLLSLVLANARALNDQTGTAPVILLDEVAAHLDRDRQAALYDEINGLGAQAWLTGTGRELFDALADRAQYLSVSEEGGISKVSA